MSTIAREFTKEQLITQAQENVAQWRDAMQHNVNTEYAAIRLRLAEFALASLEVEPVKCVNADQMHRVCLEANRHLDKYGAMAKEVNKLLGRAAPPASVSVPECFARFHEVIKNRHYGRMPEEVLSAFDECAAMLQGADQTNYRAIVERIAEIIHGKVTDIDLLTVTVKSMKDKLQK
ncbi:TPA: hypothetical protein JG912_004015 [Enterobacter hormaechei subsp. steigerwaltii]|nr:hypothetical protein [Enterobacter hormaechei subsp. steigerwaltii]